MLRASADPETLPPPSAGADEIRNGAEEILGRPEFQQPPKSLYQRALDEISERIDDLLNALISGGRGAVLAWLVLAAVIGAVGWLLLRGLQRDRRRRDGSSIDAVEIDARRPAADWAAEAARFEAAEAWRDALRCRYRWLIASLARAGVVDEIPGTTSGEYRALVGAARPTVAGPITDATALFERAWYGNQPTGPDEASSFNDLARLCLKVEERGRVLSDSSR